MCGIVGYVGKKNAVQVVMQGLSRLEYRGYDSAGIAFLPNVGHATHLQKYQGQLSVLQNHIRELDPTAIMAIGHTRWATHGVPSDANAHPHKYGRVQVVHNGIIENYAHIKNQLLAEGHHFSSETDTEVIAHLIDQQLSLNKNPLDALRTVADILRGAYSLAISLDGDPHKLYFAKLRSPLLLGRSHDGVFIASDEFALVDFGPQVAELVDGDFGYISEDEVEIFSLVEKTTALRKLSWQPLRAVADQVSKGSFKHFMHKEIFEQPEAIKRALAGRVGDGKINLPGLGLDFSKAQVKRIHIVACGSAYYAGLVAKTDLEAMLKISVDVEIASEYRYRQTLTDEHTLVIAISQSGETADTLAAIEKALSLNASCMSICNVVGSAIWRKCEGSVGNLSLNAGPEISVASTKAFTSQIVVAKLLALALAKHLGGLSADEEVSKVRALLSLPHKITDLLGSDNMVRLLASNFIDHPKMLYIGRGDLYPIAYEGALKMKELAYIFAEGYPAGELKHGPIATVDSDMPVVVLFGNDDLMAKTLSNLSEVKARGAKIISIAPMNAELVQEDSDFFIGLDEVDPFVASLMSAVIVQLLAYHLCDLKGLDVDKPRNLAKSVTVE
jgi:glucosamine--fructose-6-phosphate aminotransferase (isomerizing)